MVSRLIKFYRSSHRQRGELGPIWDFVISKHTVLKSALESGVESDVAAALENPTLFGIENDMLGGSNSELIQSCLQAIGQLPFRNPEQESPSKNWSQDLTDNQLVAPKRFNPNKQVPARMPFYYCAHVSIERLTRHNPSHILEIGPGLGNMALLLTKGSYTTIDLPLMAVLSAYFIAGEIGESAVWLAGESGFGDFVRIFSAWDYVGAADRKYDVVFNSDSFPEIPIDQQDCYLQFASQNMSNRGIFYSINHESDAEGQSSVALAMARSGRFRLVSRHHFALRPGYAEEVYELH